MATWEGAGQRCPRPPHLARPRGQVRRSWAEGRRGRASGPRLRGAEVWGTGGRAHLSQGERGERCPAWPGPVDWAGQEYGWELPSSMRGTPPSPESPSRVRRKEAWIGKRHQAQLSLNPKTQRGSERALWEMMLGGAAVGGEWGLCQPCCYLGPGLQPLQRGQGKEAHTCRVGRSRWPLVCDRACVLVEQTDGPEQVKAGPGRRPHVHMFPTTRGVPYSVL